MGVVYKARQLDLDRDVAVKLIAPDRIDDSRTRARFLSEARAAAAVEHPNVLPVYAAGIADGRAYLVMRYVPGDDLRAVVRRAGPLPVERAAEIAVAIGDALDAIHRAGFVHRDVKPANVLIDGDGHVYLSDFGLAKHVLVSAGLTESDRWVGTLDFAAPEQIRGGRVDARTDVYALGGVLHFMLTGAVPFERESEEAKLWAHLTADPPPPSTLRPNLPAALDDVVLRALAKDPDERHPSAGDLGRAARAAAGGGDAGPERAVARGPAASGTGPSGPALLEGSETILSRPPPASAGRRRRGLVTGAVVAALALAATIAVLATREDGGAESQPPAPSPPRAAQVGATVKPVGFRPRGIAALDGDLWVISATRGRVARISADTMRPHGTQPLIGRGAVSIAAYGDSVWVAITRQGRVVELDSRTGKVRRRLPVPVGPVLVAAGPSGLWVVGHGQGAAPDVLFRYDRAGRLMGQAEVQDDVTALAVGGGTAWIAHAGVPRRILGYDAKLRVRHSTWPEGDVGSLAYGGGRVWASIPDDDSVARFDPRTGQIVISGAARSPAGLAVAGGSVFVASNTDHTLAVIDPDRPRRVELRLRLPLNPWAVTAGAGHVWVTGLGGNTLTRIDY
jgi:DNA-binding beta-propeller fold protein YncE